jgi:hypothetical protein
VSVIVGIYDVDIPTARPFIRVRFINGLIVRIGLIYRVACPMWNKVFALCMSRSLLSRQLNFLENVIVFELFAVAKNFLAINRIFQA